MGTRFELVLVDEMPQALLRAAGEEALAEIEEAHRRLSAFARDSVISHLNRAACLGPGAGPIPVDAELWRLLMRCDELVDSTYGAFDPGLGLRMEQLGFRGNDGDEAPYTGGWRGAVKVDQGRPRVTFAHSSIALDLGGVAKGYALDLAADVLQDNGVERAILHGGTSTVLALGPPPGHDAWRVALGHGHDAPVAHLNHACLSISDIGGRMATKPGSFAGHVLDPRTGASARGAKRAAIVVALDEGDALMADALSTAALVSGSNLQVPSEVELWSLSDVGAIPEHIVPPGTRARIRPHHRAHSASGLFPSTYDTTFQP